MAKKRKSPQEWTPAMIAELRKHSKGKTRVAKIEKIFKRSGGALRQKALALGIPLGHRTRRRKKR
jgi:hypothetical protein